MNCLIAVIGPTAIGKSALALHLARKYNGEIVNADSRQVYRFMDIGTAKPKSTERTQVPHHLIDIVNPDDSFSLAIYKKLASEKISDIHQRNKIPIMVGGSGLYIWSVIEGWTIPEVKPCTDLRKQMESIAHTSGTQVLFEKLRNIDPIAAGKITPTNLRRIIRALEIYNSTGKPPSQFWQKRPLNIPILIIGMTSCRKKLYAMIDNRVDTMIQCGLVDEVRNLLSRGYSLDLPAMSGIGYNQIGMFLNSKLSLSEAIQKIKYDTHGFARRQYTWFQLTDDRINWFDICDTIYKNIETKVELLLKNSNPED